MLEANDEFIEILASGTLAKRNCSLRGRAGVEARMYPLAGFTGLSVPSKVDRSIVPSGWTST